MNCWTAGLIRQARHWGQACHPSWRGLAAWVAPGWDNRPAPRPDPRGTDQASPANLPIGPRFGHRVGTDLGVERDHVFGGTQDA